MTYLESSVTICFKSGARKALPLEWGAILDTVVGDPIFVMFFMIVLELELIMAYVWLSITDITMSLTW